MWGSEFTYTHITSLLAPPELRLARLNLPVVAFEFANSIRPFSPRDPQHGFNAQPWVRFASPLARRVKPYVSGEMRTRLQDSRHRTYKMDI